MAGVISLNTVSKNAILDAMAVSFANGIIRGYSGTQASVLATDPGVAHCVQFTEAAGAFVSGVATNGLNFLAAASGEMSKDAEEWKGLGLSNATISWFRFYNNDLSAWFQGTVNTSGAVMTVTTTAVVTEVPMIITSFKLRF